ncbi:MAG TPA: TIGR03016 family PEP-CTERM system-associated outer membrane protein [Acidobacteriaceae bacterium]|nr:TIGR03016 family PEP-CTERM system-associated outer membrane protein [Acidobacteriaceae bacterium]
MQNQQGRDSLFAPMLTVREVYSDNVTLAPKGEEKNDFITQVIPGFTVCDSGPRWRGQLHYELQGLYYAKHQSLNHIYNNAQGSGTAELFRNHLFFDASTFYGQQTIDPTQTFSTDNTLATGNRTNTWSLNLSPYWRQSLGALGLSTLRYRYGSVMYDTGRVPDSHSNTFSFDLVNPPTNTLWSWNAYVRSEQVDREDRDRTTYFDTASLDLGYQVFPHIRLLAEGGVEDDYRPDGSTDRWGSEFWNAGFLWAGERTSLEARYGHRFFGPSYFAQLRHQAARLTTSLSYTEEPQVVSRLGIDNPNAVLLPNQPPGLIFEPSDETLTPLTNDEVFVRKRFAGNATYQTGRSTISLDTFLERREFQVSDNDERVRGFTVYWRWQWLPRTALIPRWSWEKIDFQSDQTDYLSRQQISLAHLISPTAQAAVTLRHQWRNSTRAESEYTENAVILEFTKIF